MNRLLLAIAMCFAALACGCNADRDIDANRDLLAIGMEYHWFVDEKRRAPKNEAELASFENPYADVSVHDADRVRAALKSGKYVIIWNADILDDRMPRQEKILAYEVNAPTEGGVVCFQNTLVERITKERFSEAMAKTSSAMANE